MANMNISSAQASNMSNLVSDVTVPSMSVDSAGEQDETSWQNSKWTSYWGYFNECPDLKSAIIMKAIFNVGKGWSSDPRTTVILDHIKGWGKDTFDDILFNMEIVRRVGGEAYAEIIRADDGTLINLKPLDPGSMKIIVDRQGVIKRFEQETKNKGTIKFKPEDIFFLCNNRAACQIHGISDIMGMEKTILAEYESCSDMKRLMHWQARPMIMFKLGTDDTAKIAAFQAKMDAAVNKGENIYIPFDPDMLQYEVIQVNPGNAVFEWRNDIRNKFYRTIGLPQIVPGAGGQGTESESKVIYLAFEQIVKKDQRYLELQIWNQLHLKIKLEPPTALMQDLQADSQKDAGIGIQQGEMTPGAGI